MSKNINWTFLAFYLILMNKVDYIFSGGLKFVKFPIVESFIYKKYADSLSNNGMYITE